MHKNMSTGNNGGNIFQNLTNQYTLSRTLRFELKPVGKTKRLVRQIKEGRDFESPLVPLISEDENRAKAYKETKKLIDKLHQKFLKFALDKENIPTEEEKEFKEKITRFYDIYEKDKKDSELVQIQKELAETLIRVLDADARKFEEAFLRIKKEYLQTAKKELEEKIGSLEALSKELIDKIKQTIGSQTGITGKEKEQQDGLDQKIKQLKANKKRCETTLKFTFDKSSKLYDKSENTFCLLYIYYAEDEEAIAQVKQFEGFRTYFKGFNENRANVYNIEGKNKKDSWHFLSTSIAHRIFEQNLKFHSDNIVKWKKIKKSRRRKSGKPTTKRMGLERSA